MKRFQFPINSRTSMAGGTRWTEIVLGTVKLLMRADLLIAVKNATECFHIAVESDEAMVNLWIGKAQQPEAVDYQTVLFQVNRMLYEQAKAIMEPVLDAAFVRPRGDDAQTGEFMAQAAVVR